MATSILMTGVPSSAALWIDSNDPDQVDLRKSVGLDALKKELAVTGVLDGIRFVPFAAPVPILFQFAKCDHFSIESMRAYADAATGAKQTLWYPTGHALNDPQALTDRAKWLEQKIGLRGAVKAEGTLSGRFYCVGAKPGTDETFPGFFRSCGYADAPTPARLIRYKTCRRSGSPSTNRG